MLVLDTDHVSLLEQLDSPEGRRLRERLAPVPEAEKATSIISFEEQTRGWMAVLAQARDMARLIDAYRRLKQQLTNYCAMNVLEFGERSAVEFQRLRKMRIQIGTMDLKIASITLAHDATLLTCNSRDFRKVPGLKFEDWTI